MSYHGLGFELPGVELPGVIPIPPETTAYDAEVAAKVAARDAAREEARRVDELKRQMMEAEELRRRDVSLPGREFVEDWEPVPEAEVVVEEPKVPWLMIGVGSAAVLGLGYFIWSR